LYAAYARAQQARILASVVGEDGLTEVDRKFLRFGRHFESDIIGHGEPRKLEDSMAAGWHGLKLLPTVELHRLSDDQIDRHLADGQHKEQ
jgi:V/A-type H+-transporting ATPase subunit B